MEEISEKRGSFRVSVDAPVRCYLQEDKERQNPQECTLVTIGVDGACVDSKYRYEKNKILCFQVELENFRPMFLMGQIMRIDKAEAKGYRYDVLFAQIWDDELQQLNHVLKKLQR